MASCLKAIWNQRFLGVVCGAAQLLCFSVLISELTNQKEVSAWTYNYSAKAYSWNYSRAFCQKYFTDLVAIQNKNEIAHLNDVIPYHSSYYWIGIRKINDQWTWVGTKKTLTKEAENWADHEPNNKRNNQDCVEIYIKSESAAGKWNDEPCWKRKRALCYTASCQDTSCSQQGECIETIGSYRCSCYPGFYGPECEHVRECGELDLPRHVLANCSHPLGNFSVSSQCSFRCAEGFRLDGPSRLECSASGNWTEMPPQCVAVQCPPLKTPERGRLTCLPSAKAFQSWSSCRFSCEEGFVLVGPEVVQCTGSGAWTAPAPACQAVQCQRLEAPDKGTMNCVHPLAAFGYGSSCTFGCQAGYRARGSGTLRCVGSGQWTAPPPACEAITCEPLQRPAHGTMACSPSSGVFQHSTNCSFHCAEGFVLRGADLLQCTDTGQWTAPPPVCQVITCTRPLSPRNGTMTCDQPLEDSDYRSTCHFSCDEGFSLSGPERLDCTPSGLWTSSPPTCEAIKCPELLAPEQGSLDCSDVRGKFTVGATSHFSCDEGFQLEGTGTLQCVAPGRWSAPPPACRGLSWVPTPEVRCPALLTPGQGSMSCRHHLGNFGLNTTCHFGCHAGFTLLGDKILRCRPSGRWTAVTPECRAVKCSELHSEQPVLMNCSNPWGNFSFGSTCTFHCPEGQLLNDSAETTCRESGHWSAPMPACQAGPLTIQQALAYFGGAVASTTGLAVVGTLLALLRRRCRQKDDGKCPLNPHSHLGTYGVFTNAAFDPTP
ncbi:P-selectin [Tupaia chinensis]|uniref:P-selectin n=1 Tax=Tupaia chinensis TaxID=246437 RepID=UPI0003C911B0|nr:P-selectin [Tupaia chinensis]XP_027628290.1 P-selectin [Tupaia chinensis]